jgi:hypothetical protein
VSARTRGTAIAGVHQRFDLHQPLAETSAGMQAREVFLAEAFLRERAMARASPSARVAVVLAVGARFIGHASSATWQLRVTSDACPRVDSVCPVSEMSFAPIRRIASSRPDQLFGLAAVRQRNNDVVLLDHAEVAVHRFGGVKKDRRRAGARQASPTACAR